MSNKIQLDVHFGMTGAVGDSPTPHQQFIETARQLGTDKDKAAFEAKLAQTAWHKLKVDVPEVPEDRE